MHILKNKEWQITKSSQIKKIWITLWKILLYQIKTIIILYNHTTGVVVSGCVVGLQKACVRFLYFSTFLIPSLSYTCNGQWLPKALLGELSKLYNGHVCNVEGYLTCILVQLSGRDQLPSKSYCYTHKAYRS